ncbi:hypothetical protein [Shewanella sp. 125m-1]
MNISSVSQAIALEEKLHAYENISIKDEVIRHCMDIEFLTIDDINKKTERFLWINNVITLKYESINMLRLNAHEAITLENMDEHIRLKKQQITIIIKKISDQLAASIPLYFGN